MRRFGRVVAALVVTVSIGVVAAASPASGRARIAAQGVSDKEILVVAVVADLDSLRAKGLIAQPKLTTGNLLKRFQLYADAYGPIHGRKVVVKGVTVDPLDPTSFDKVCTQATQDNKPFVVVNGAGFRTSAVPCVTVDNHTPLFSGDPMTTALFKESGNNLFALPPSGDVMGATTADVVAKQKLVPKATKIGILSSNDIGIKAAGDALEAEFEKNGYTVAKKIELNGLSGDASALNRESSAAVGTFTAAGVDTVFVGVQFSAMQGFFQENQRSQADLKTFVIDDAASMCTPFSASRIPLEAAGTPCVSTWDTKALPTKNGVQKDSTAEADCRASFDDAFDATSQPGVPAGDLTAGGVTYSEDFASTECNMMSLLLPAMAKAGKNLTWPKVAANLAQTTSAPAIYMSDGDGGFAKNKHYFADKVHLVVLNPANTQTAKGSDGLFNGCPAPVNCWVPQLVDGAEWFPVR